MTLDEAEAHIGHPVRGLTAWPRSIDGQIASVDRNRGMVGVHERRRSAPYLDDL